MNNYSYIYTSGAKKKKTERHTEEKEDQATIGVDFSWIDYLPKGNAIPQSALS